MRILTEGFEGGTRPADWTGSGGTISTSSVRSGDYALWLNSSTYYRHIPLPNGTEYFFKLAHRPSTDPCVLYGVFAFDGSASLPLLYVGLVSGKVVLGIATGANSYTVVATGTTAISTFSYYVVQMHVKLVPGGNSIVEVCVNSSIPEIIWSGDLTEYQEKSWQYLTLLNIGRLSASQSSGNNTYIDDIAINTPTGSTQNSWPGLGKVIALKPEADTATKDWSASAGSDNYAMVDETPPDDETTYVTTSSTGAEDIYDVAAPPDLTGLVIAGVWTEIVARKLDSASAATVVPGIVSGGVKSWAPPAALPTSYTKIIGPFLTANPADSESWEYADLANIKVSIKASSTG